MDTSPDYGKPYDSIAAEMPVGSVLIWHGSLWHGGGANRTEQRRVGIAMYYCAGYIRQQENQQLGIAPALVRKFTPRLRELVGCGIYKGLIGRIDKKSPAQLLDLAGDQKLIWEMVSRASRLIGACAGVDSGTMGYGRSQMRRLPPLAH